MKDIFSLVLVMLGASIFGRGFKTLSPALQDKFAKQMYEIMSALLTKSALESATKGEKQVGRNCGNCACLSRISCGFTFYECGNSNDYRWFKQAAPLTTKG